MTFEEIKDFIDFFNKSGLSACKVSIPDAEGQTVNVELEKKPQTAVNIQELVPAQSVAAASAATVSPDQAAVVPVVEQKGDFIKSPMVGACYFSPSPEADTFVKVGDKIKKGQTVAIIEAMKIMNELQAEQDCEILEILLEDAHIVEFDTPIFKIKPL